MISEYIEQLGEDYHGMSFSQSERGGICVSVDGAEYEIFENDCFRWDVMDRAGDIMARGYVSLDSAVRAIIAAES